MSRVHVNRKALADVMEQVDRFVAGHLINPVSTRAIEEVRRALAPKKSKPARIATKKAKAQKKTTKREETEAIRAEVFGRSGGYCELCGAAFLDWGVGRGELHHVFGRVRVKQAADNCLALCGLCHRDITENRPSAAVCLEKQARVLEKHGHRATALRLRQRVAALELLAEAKAAANGA